MGLEECVYDSIGLEILVPTDRVRFSYQWMDILAFLARGVPIALFGPNCKGYNYNIRDNKGYSYNYAAAIIKLWIYDQLTHR